MVKGELIRIIDKDTSCTKGALTIDGEYVCRTLELPWKENQRNVSCIPVGTYVCRRALSPRFNETFEITGVRGRDHILFHSGNKTRDTEGCVLVGKTMSSKVCYVNDSRVTRAIFMSTLKGVEEFELTIVED